MMKNRLLCTTLLACFLTTGTAPAYSATPITTAETTDQGGLSTAIEKAKVTLGIDGAIWDDFTYSGYESDYGQRWSLNWSQSAAEEHRLSATVDLSGNVLSYSYYRPLSASGLAAIRLEVAQKNAEDFLNKVAPHYAKTLVRQPERTNRQWGDSFCFVYQQEYDGVLVQNGTVDIRVNKYTGTVTDFVVNEAVNVTTNPMPAKNKVIGQSAANKALLSEIGLQMAYLSRYDYTDKSYSVYPAYQMAKHHLVIDAITGKAIPLKNVGINQNLAKAESAANDRATGGLSPKEQAAVDGLGTFLSKEAATEKLLHFTAGINSGYTLHKSALYTSYNEKDRYIWRLSLTAPDNESTLSGTVDAKTGQVLSFYDMSAAGKSSAEGVSQAQADATVTAFLRSIAPAELKACRLVQDEEDAVPIANLDNTYYNYRYERLVNGIPFADNGITVGYNAQRDKVESYQLHWNTALVFPSIDKAKSAKAISDDVINGGDFRLMYQRDGQHYRLIYDFYDKSALRFDPFSGEQLNGQGEAYRSDAMPTYQWQGTPSESGTRLYENGIYLDRDTLNGDLTVTQQDMATLLYRSRYPYSDATDSDEIYRHLASTGIIPAQEVAPQHMVTRQECARYGIRLLGYEKLATHDALFVYPYQDDTTAEYKASVAMAGALGLLKADAQGHIQPEAAITLRDAFDVLYGALR